MQLMETRAQEEGIRRILRGWLRDMYVAKEVRVNELGNHEDADFTLVPTRSFLLYDEMGLGKTIQVRTGTRARKGV